MWLEWFAKYTHCRVVGAGPSHRTFARVTNRANPATRLATTLPAAVIRATVTPRSFPYLNVPRNDDA
jgi:hypothetical protein